MEGAPAADPPESKREGVIRFAVPNETILKSPSIPLFQRGRLFPPFVKGG